MLAVLRPRSLWLVVALMAGAPFLLDCESSSGKGFADDEDAIQAPPRLLGFTYVPRDGRVMVKVDRAITIDPETTIRARVRWGTLRYGGEAALDCDALADDERTSVALTGEETSTGTSFPGPSVESSMQRQYYEDNLIGIDATQEQLAAIERGTDPIVEGCLWQSGRVVARAQMSLYRAWDEATPELVKRLQEVENGSASNDVTFHSVTTYGELCERELGPNPFFPKQQDGTYATYDCTNPERSVVIPITVTSSSGGEPVPQTSDPSDGRCDHPDWLRRSCSPYARVNRATNDLGTHWVLLCRKMLPGQKPEDTTFNDIAMIGHNPKTGKTCFFQNGLYGKTDAARVANPADPRSGETTWSSFEVHTCNACHDNDAFAHSPWIDQAMYPDGRYVVPRIQSDPDFSSDGPYWILGMKGREMRKKLVSQEAAVCTSCHRLSDGNTLSGRETGGGSWVERSIGEDDAFNRHVTSAVQSDFARARWMPPGASEGSFASTYGDALRFLDGCKQGSSNCRYESMPR